MWSDRDCLKPPRSLGISAGIFEWREAIEGVVRGEKRPSRSFEDFLVQTLHGLLKAGTTQTRIQELCDETIGVVGLVRHLNVLCIVYELLLGSLMNRKKGK